jgi:phosphatidate cytidylyltransferase
MKQRVITGVLAGILFLGVAIIGGMAFTILTVIMAIIGFSEFLRMKKISLYSFSGIIGFILVIFTVPSVEFVSFPVIDLFLVAFLVLLIYTVLSNNGFHFDKAAFVILSAFYVTFGFHYLIVARADGIAVLFFILFVLWSTDSGAYFTGRAIGKRKLWPEISPKKTIEGSIGGIVAAFVIAVLFQLLFPLYESMAVALIAALVISVFGQLGDLVESAFKRHYGVKDSGSILPGHGGILDRCDSWLFVLPILHLLHFIG